MIIGIEVPPNVVDQAETFLLREGKQATKRAVEKLVGEWYQSGVVYKMINEMRVQAARNRAIAAACRRKEKLQEAKP